MKKTLIGCLIPLASIGLTACITDPPMDPPAHYRQHVNRDKEMDDNGVAIGGNVRKSMDNADRKKLAHALDNPLGKPVRWVNANTGISYTVTPLKKVAIDGNPYCRTYSIAAMTKSHKETQMEGRACVSAKGEWNEL